MGDLCIGHVHSLYTREVEAFIPICRRETPSLLCRATPAGCESPCLMQCFRHALRNYSATVPPVFLIGEVLRLNEAKEYKNSHAQQIPGTGWEGEG